MSNAVLDPNESLSVRFADVGRLELRVIAKQFCVWLLTIVFVMVQSSLICSAEPVSLKSTQIVVLNADKAENNSSVAFQNMSGQIPQKAETEKIEEPKAKAKNPEFWKYVNGFGILAGIIIGGIYLQVTKK